LRKLLKLGTPETAIVKGRGYEHTIDPGFLQYKEVIEVSHPSTRDQLEVRIAFLPAKTGFQVRRPLTGTDSGKIEQNHPLNSS
jgi:hypothetical protein